MVACVPIFKGLYSEEVVKECLCINQVAVNLIEVTKKWRDPPTKGFEIIFFWNTFSLKVSGIAEKEQPSAAYDLKVGDTLDKFFDTDYRGKKRRFIDFLLQVMLKEPAGPLAWQDYLELRNFIVILQYLFYTFFEKGSHT